MTSSLPPPPPTTVRLGSLIIAFFVTFPIGLAPFLGMVDVPYADRVFQPLLGIIPEHQHVSATIVAAFACGLVAVGTQLGAGSVARNTLRWLGFACIGASFVALVYLTMLAGDCTESIEGRIYTTGAGGRAAICQKWCEPEISDAQCIRERITTRPGMIETCWGEENVKAARHRMGFAYLAAVIAAVIAVAVLLLMKQRPGEPE